ncbi:hypothetical protein DFQ28_006383 [Apophysomyces sp. BC1034]|nr:hypothetical protein DFQ30_006245 [Apophysomyces sp. BC1015]KAG0177123.1 hypothetical protein DFQ29_005210 [Apophysomyces sp. BC1021]KAG0187419.1 hypothetical protein DFQ28_006383 [Apophysomyces sp. BC1034]
MFPNLTLHYFIVPGKRSTIGRGENIKLLLEDAGIEHEYVRHHLDKETWPEKKKALEESGYYAATLPYIEIESQKFGQTVPIMRYICNKLGKYMATNDEDAQYLDALSDISYDWHKKINQTYFSSLEVRQAHEAGDMVRYLEMFEKVYSDREGPYILGEEITYPDFLIYHLIDDEQQNKKLEAYPNLNKFVRFFEERSNIKKYLATL